MSFLYVFATVRPALVVYWRKKKIAWFDACVWKMPWTVENGKKLLNFLYNNHKDRMRVNERFLVPAFPNSGKWGNG